MKKLLFTLTLLITLSSFGQKQKATLFFKNGVILEGFAHFGSFNSKISYKKTKKSKKLFFDAKTINKIIVHSKKEDSEYHYRRIKGRNSYAFIKPTLKGKVTLYIIKTESDQNHKSITYFYVSKGVNEDLKELRSSLRHWTNFKKIASNYFKDCPKLVKKIQSKEFRKRDIVEVVEYYNDNCGE